MMGHHKEPMGNDRVYGPIHNRSCTDIVWLILFILFLGLWGFAGYFSFTHGSAKNLLAPIDSSGHRCGSDRHENQKHMVFFNILRCLSPGLNGCPTPQVCVEQCPNKTIFFNKEVTAVTFEQMRSSMVCIPGVNITTMTSNDALNYIKQDKCASYVVKSQSVLGRCIPSLTELGEFVENSAKDLDISPDQLVRQLKTLVQFDQLSSKIVHDLVQSRWYMAGGLVVVVLICFVYILLLRWIVGPVIWTSIVGFFAALGFVLFLCYKNYKYYSANPVSLVQTINVKGYYLQSIFMNANTWLVILIIVAIFLVILLVIIVFLRGRIVIAIALIKEGSKAVTAIKSTVLFPIFPWLLQCAVIAYGIAVLMHLMSIDDLSPFRITKLAEDTTCNCNGVYTRNDDSCHPLTFRTSCFDSSNGFLRACKLASCDFRPSRVTCLHFVNLLGFCWTMFFISGVADMMLASTFSTWYWTFHKKDLPFFTLTAGMSRTIKYHLGTVAFGALIIAIVRVIRVILEYIDRQLKKFDNPFTRCIMCCCKCFFWCLENFIKFINKNAYIMCAVHGKNFCSSARDAFSLLMRNIVRVVVLDKVMDFIFFLSKLLISIGVGFAVYYLLQWNYVYEVTQGERLHYSYVPAVILAVATYLVSTIFFNVYAMAVDTLFLCFLEDCDRNDGSPEKPYFMSTNLLKILSKKNKRE